MELKCMLIQIIYYYLIYDIRFISSLKGQLFNNPIWVLV